MLKTLRIFPLLALVAIALSEQLSSQSEPDRGSVSGNVYSNQFLGLTWEYPKDWTVADNEQKPEVATGRRLVRLLPGGPTSTESIDLNYAELGSRYVENPTQELKGKGWEAIEGHGYYTLGGGTPAYRYDYKSKESPPRYLTILVGPRHNVGLRLSFHAASLDRIQELVNASLAMKIRPDWSSGTQENLVPPTVSGSKPLRVRVSQGVGQKMLEHKVQPIYPKDAKASHIQGGVLLLGHIGTDGAIKDLYVLEGHPLLAESALEAVSQWKYRPYTLQGKPVEVETQFLVNFELP